MLANGRIVASIHCMQRGEFWGFSDFNNSDLDVLVALGNNDGQDNLPPCESRVIAAAWRVSLAC